MPRHLDVMAGCRSFLPMQTALSVQDIRAQFPALARRHNGHAVAYFDGPGGTQIPRAVAEAMTAYLYHHNANTHWAYPTSRETDAALLAARTTLGDFLNAPADSIVFGPNMTSLTFHVARALGRDWLPGDEVIVTDLDHHANIDPWRDLAAEQDLVIRAVPFDPCTGQLDLTALERALSARTRLVAVGFASNALGTINDVAHVVDLAKAAKALTFVDAVHYAPHVLPDVEALGCDFFACSPYKFYGPHAGVLYGRRALLDRIKVARLVPAPQASPERIETGTLSHEAIVGSAAAVDFLASIGSGAVRRDQLAHAFAALHARAATQIRHLWHGLACLPHVTLHGPGPDNARTPTVAFTVDGYTSESVSAQLADQGLFLSHGDFYAWTVVQRLGIEGLVRAGCACYTTDEEVERLISAIKTLR